MESRKRRHFPGTCQREAVDRSRNSGVTIIQVAEELGLHETVLRRWIRRFARLKRELQKAQMERRILKKAALAIVPGPSAYMPTGHGSLFAGGSR